MSVEFTIGADPELFCRDKLTGKFISAHDLIPGTKISPHPVNLGAIQRDGVAAEFNIYPAETRDQFVNNIQTVMSELESFLPDHIELVAEPTAYFDKEYFDALPQTPKLLGCTPDWNAYTGQNNYPPSTDETFRTGSGHVHVGFVDFADIYDDDHIRLCCQVVKQLDVALYYPSLSWDKDMKRRELYGKIGSFRPCPYGVEYRPLSNAYLRDVQLIEYVYDQTVWAMDLFFNKGIKLYENAPELPEKYR